MLVNSKTDEYIEEICSYVKFKKARNEIKTEFINHIEEKTEDLMLSGMNEEDAARKAITEMGEAETVGKLLNESHKGTPEWSILLITVALSLIGLIVSYLLIAYGLNENSAAFKKTAIFTITGYIVMGALYLFDYKKLEKYSVKIFILTTLTLFLQLLLSNPINVSNAWISLGLATFKFTIISLLLYVISLAHLIRTIKLNNLKGYLYLSLMLVIPACLFVLTAETIEAGIYFIIFVVLMIKSKVKKSFITSVIGIFTVGFFYFIISEPYRIKRIMYFLNPTRDPEGAGWLNIQLHKTLSSAGYFGNGFNLPKRFIPELGTDFVLTYIIYTFGWIAGIILILFIAAFIIRMLAASNMVKDTYGGLIIQGFMIIFGIEFIWNILMVMGFAPIAGVSLPFISYGGSSLLCQMGAIGLIMSIYKSRSLSYS